MKRRRTFCGLCAHGTRRGVLRCAAIAGRLVRSLGVPLQLRSVRDVVYRFRPGRGRAL